VAASPPSAPLAGVDRGDGGRPPTAVGADQGGADGSQGIVGAAAGRPHWAVFFGIAVTIVVVDQIVKAWVVASFDVGVVYSILGDWIWIAVSHNNGALFGLFRDSAILFAIFSLAVIGVILFYEAKAGRAMLVTVALGLLLGGAVGNLIDRLRLGYVVDFVDIGIGSWRFYTFNIADSAITCAVLLLILIAVLPVFGDATNRG
jgi:signal peptidase II